jgi:hypothetical protein
VLEGGAAAGQLATDMAAAGGETMMTREQLLHLFSRFSFVTSLPGRSPSPPRFRFAPHPPPIRFPLIFVPCPRVPEVKQRIADAVRDKQVRSPRNTPAISAFPVTFGGWGSLGGGS